MRLLIAHNYYQRRGGEDTIFEAEVALLREHGHDVVEYVEQNARIATMDKLALARETIWSQHSYRKLSQILQEFQPDIAHFHNTFPLLSPAVYYACHAAKVPVIQTIQNYRLLCPAATFLRDGRVCEDCLGQPFPFSSILHQCYHDSRVQTGVLATMLSFHRWKGTWQDKIDIYIVLTTLAQQKFVAAGFPSEKIVVKPNIIHPDPGIKHAAGDYALFVGRLSPEKGLTTLLQAWQNVPHLPLRIVGEGPLADQLRAMIRDMKLQHVALLGFQNRAAVLTLMKQARFLVFPSIWYEGFPVTIAEAFACGLPVIASRMGAMMEIISDGCNGLLFSPADTNDLANKADWLWSHDAERQEMGLAARKEYETHYTASTNYANLMAIYNRAIHQHVHRHIHRDITTETEKS